MPQELASMTLAQLREEHDHGRGGLKIYAETAWGWSELKVAPFLKQLERDDGSEDLPVVLAIMTIRRGGSATLKIPRRA
jgi:hypothetical protein